MYDVIYYSRGGNTKKIAEAIAAEVGVTAKDVKSAEGIKGDQVIFLGTGCYGSKPGDDMVKFIEKTDFKGKKIALFSTSGGASGKELDVLAEALNRKGASIKGTLLIKGKMFVIFNRGKPDEADKQRARQFAREMVT